MISFVFSSSIIEFHKVDNSAYKTQKLQSSIHYHSAYMLLAWLTVDITRTIFKFFVTALSHALNNIAI